MSLPLVLNCCGHVNVAGSAVVAANTWIKDGSIVYNGAGDLTLTMARACDTLNSVVVVATMSGTTDSNATYVVLTDTTIQFLFWDEAANPIDNVDFDFKVYRKPGT